MGQSQDMAAYGADDTGRFAYQPDPAVSRAPEIPFFNDGEVEVKVWCLWSSLDFERF
jgi:hypothetical protein